MPDPYLSVAAVARAYVANRGSGTATAAELKCSKQTVYERLRCPEGQKALAEYTGQVLEQYHVSAQRVVGEAAALAFSDLPRILRSATTIEALNELEAHHRAAIAEVQLDDAGNVLRVKLHAKVEPLKLLAVYAEIAGLGGQPRGADGAGKAELGGLTLIGPKEATTDEARPIPRPERVE